MPFDFQSCLQGGLLELRPLRGEDFRELCAAAADPLIWEQHPSKDRYQEEVLKNFFQDALDSQSASTVIDSKDHQIIGSSRYHGYDEKRGEIEIGWTFLTRSHRGGTYNRELKSLMLNHAFQFVSSVIFLVEPDNLRSQRAVEKIGGVRSDSSTDGSGRKSLAYRIEACSWMDAAV